MHDRDKPEIRELIEQDLNLFRMSLYIQGVEIEKDELSYLLKNGYLKEGMLRKDTIDNYMDRFRDFDHSVKIKGVFDLDDEVMTKHQIDDANEIFLMKNNTKLFSSNVTRDQWSLDIYKDDDYQYSDDFRNWILSMYNGFDKRISYERFEIYKHQAMCWEKDRKNYSSTWDEEDRLGFIRLERKKILENSLYAANRHGFLKMRDKKNDGNSFRRYKAWESQEVLLYLFDCYVNFMVAKARQIGGTTTLCIPSIMRTMLTKGFFTKLVAQKGDKSKEIFNDKVKFPLGKFSSYLMPTVSSDSISKYEFKYKGDGKGTSKGAESRFEVEAPAADCVNGGSPDLVLLDEIGMNDMFGEIVAQGRPTLFAYDDETGKQEMQRQLIGWGTGGDMMAGGAAFESEFRPLLKAFTERDYGDKIIPVFLNAFARKGFNKEMYEAEKKVYYSKKKIIGKEDPKIVFQQSYCITLDDVFLLSSDTIIPVIEITNLIDRCNKRKKIIRGVFEPIFDNSVVYGESKDVPYKIIGAKFIPCSDEDIMENKFTACVYMIEKPCHLQEGVGRCFYENRYYQGIDPIITSSGLSDMAGSIFDSLDKSPKCVVAFKHPDYRFCYLQMLLQNLYYSNSVNGISKGIKCLIEANVGGEYINYVTDHGYKNTLIRNSKLPEILHTKSQEYGVWKETNKVKYLLNYLERLLNLYRDRIEIAIFYEQLKTFVRKKTIQNIAYGPQNDRFHRDDVIDAVLYSYIASECYSTLPPSRIGSGNDVKKKTKTRYVMGPNYTLQLIKTQV
jgi:hypothetical protein